MRNITRTQSQQHRQRRLELAIFAPANPPTRLALILSATLERAGASDAADEWFDSLTDQEFGDLFGPAWSQMTRRQRRLYPDGLSELEKDQLWGMECSQDAGGGHG